MTKRATTLTRGVNQAERLPADQYRVAVYSVKNVGALENAYLELDADQRLVIFTGENGAGKTTAARSAPAHALLDAPWQMEEPQRKGALEAYEIKFTLAGEKQTLIATKTEKGGLVLEVLQGGRKSRLVRPDEVIKEIVDPLTLDPLGFMALESKQQVARLFNTLHIDEALETLDQEKKKDEAERAGINAEIRTLEKLIELYVEQPLPAEKHDIARLERELEAADDFNITLGQKLAERARLAAALEKARDNRDRNQKLIEDIQQEIADGTPKLGGLEREVVEAQDIREVMAGLLPRAQAFTYTDAPTYAIGAAHAQWISFAQILSDNCQTLRERLGVKRQTLTAAEHQVERLENAVTAAEQDLEQAPAGEPMPVKELREAIRRAASENQEIDKRAQYERDQASLNEHLTARDEVQARIDNCEPRKKEAIATAIVTAIKAGTLPQGLTFTTEQVYYNNLPLKQLGQAEQLRITIMLALASGPQLRLVCIPDGDAFDPKSLLALQQMAAEMKFYIFMARWIEPETGTVLKIENGRIKPKNKRATAGREDPDAKENS